MYLSSNIKQLDIWDVQIECREGGGIQTVQKLQKGKTSTKNVLDFTKKPDNKSENQLILRRKMSNYCSFGLDAKIGLNFELKRTSSRFRNKLIYGIEGLRRFFGKQMRLKSYVERFEILNYIYSKIDLKQKSHLGSMYNDDRIV